MDVSGAADRDAAETGPASGMRRARVAIFRFASGAPTRYTTDIDFQGAY